MVVRVLRRAVKVLYNNTPPPPFNQITPPSFLRDIGACLLDPRLGRNRCSCSYCVYVAPPPFVGYLSKQRKLQVTPVDAFLVVEDTLDFRVFVSRPYRL